MVKIHYKFKDKQSAKRNVQNPNLRQSNPIDPAKFTLCKLDGMKAAAEEAWFLSHRFLPLVLKNYNEDCYWFEPNLPLCCNLRSVCMLYLHNYVDFVKKIRNFLEVYMLVVGFSFSIWYLFSL